MTTTPNVETVAPLEDQVGESTNKVEGDEVDSSNVSQNLKSKKKCWLNLMSRLYCIAVHAACVLVRELVIYLKDRYLPRTREKKPTL